MKKVVCVGGVCGVTHVFTNTSMHSIHRHIRMHTLDHLLITLEHKHIRNTYTHGL